MAGWHHWLDGCNSEWTPGVGDGQGGLACCDSWGRKESDTTERLNWTSLLFLNLYNLCCHYCDLLNSYISQWKIKEQISSSLCISRYHLMHNLSSCSQWVDILEVGVSQHSGNPNAEGLIFISQWRSYEVTLTQWNNVPIILKIRTVNFMLFYLEHSKIIIYNF